MHHPYTEVHSIDELQALLLTHERIERCAFQDMDFTSLTDEDPNIIYNHTFDFEPATTRCVKIKALVEHSIPAWHPAVGKPGWIFIDEIVIE